MPAIPDKLNWSDLQVLLYVARTGSLTAAAEQLGTSHPTLYRRVRAMEAALGLTLFKRSRQGYQPTEAAKDLLDIAESMEQHLRAWDDKTRKRTVLGTTETLALTVLPPVLSAVASQQPQLQIDLLVQDSLANVQAREVDVALRAGGTPPAELLGRVLCAIEMAVFRPADWPAVGESDLARHPWVMADDSLGHLASTQWLHRSGLAQNAAIRCNSTLAVQRLVESGTGLALLPCYLGDASPLLRRVTPCLPEFRSDLWLLSPASLRGAAHVRALLDPITDTLRAMSGLFEGRQAR